MTKSYQWILKLGKDDNSLADDLIILKLSDWLK